jgi:hypothetical protein
MPLSAIKQEVQSFATTDKFNPELQGLTPDSPPPARTVDDNKQKILKMKSEFPSLFVKNLILERDEAVGYYRELADRDLLSAVPVPIARAMVKSINPADTLQSNRSLVEGKLRMVFDTLVGEGLQRSAVKHAEHSTRFLADNPHKRSGSILEKSVVRDGTRKKGKKSEEHIEFGKYVVNHDALIKRHRLILKYPSRVNVMNFKQNQVVSPTFVKILSNFLKTRILDRDLYNELDDREQNLLTQLSRISETNLGISTKFSKTEKDLMNRFNLLKGEVIAGNNNPEILKELKTMILKLTHENIITKKQRDSLLYDLFIVLN